MIKFLNANQKNSLKKLEIILSKRKIKTTFSIFYIKKILYNVKKSGDQAVINYEKKFSKIRNNSKKIKFSNKEIKKFKKNR